MYIHLEIWKVAAIVGGEVMGLWWRGDVPRPWATCTMNILLVCC